jgi:murein DD-endopeptidase MepM/ murein hydrolase activator NlpD
MTHSKQPAPPADDGRARTSKSAQQTRAIDIVRDLHGPRRAERYATFSERFRKKVPPERFNPIVDEIHERQGPLDDVRVLSERPREPSGWVTVQAIALFERGAELYTVTLDEAGVVHGLVVKPIGDDAEEKGPGPADAYVSKRAYALPGAGRWVVGNGGRAAKGNNHVGNLHQWYAYDLVQHGEDGKSHRGDGKKNEDYLAFGQPVLAPADGTIITAIDGAPDNAPGDRDRYVIPGNLVIIDHGDGEHSFIAHFQRGSIVVRPGARVKQGQLLGKVGNSGNTSEPHIHWHLANHANMSRGHGLPIKLVSMLVNGNLVDTPEPVRGDTLEVTTPRR